MTKRPQTKTSKGGATPKAAAKPSGGAPQPALATGEAEGTAGASDAPAGREDELRVPNVLQTGEDGGAASSGAAAPPSDQNSAGGDQPVAAPASKPGAAEQFLVVHTRRPRARWRVGRAFGPEESLIPLAVLTDDEQAAIKADPELVTAIKTLG